MAEGNFIIRARDRTRDAFASVDNRLRGLSRMQRLSLGGLGASLSVAGLVRYGRESLRTADNIDNLANRMRLGHESVQTMGVIMREAGIPAEALGTVMDRLQQQQANALTGNKNAIKSFEDLGISLDDLGNASPEQLLERVARQLHAHRGNATTSAAATDVLGARSTRLQGVLQTLGARGFGELNAQMLKTGQIMEGDLVRAGDRMEEGLSRAFNRLGIKRDEFFARGLSGMYIFAKGMRGEIENLFGDTDRPRWLDVGADLFAPAASSASPAQELHDEAPEIGAAIAEPIAEAIKKTTEFLTGGQDIIRHFTGLTDRAAESRREREKVKYLEEIARNTRADGGAAVVGS